MKTFLKIFLIAFVFFSVAMGAGVWTFSKIYQPSVSEGFEKEKTDDVVDSNPEEPEKEKTELEKLIEASKRVNVLLMGMEGARSDTLVLASFDPETKDLNLISLPRDTYYPREGHNTPEKKKLNAVNGDEGTEGTMKAVSNILAGMPVHYYVKITYNGVERIVDSLGGVKVNVPMDMDWEDPKADPPLSIHLKKGTQVLNGDKALQFLRFRSGYPDGDLGRIKAQQQFLKAAMAKAISFRLPVVANTAIKYVKTDIPLSSVIDLATDAIGMSKDSVKTYSLPGVAETKGLSYFWHDAGATEELVKQIYKGQSADGSN